MNHILDLIVLNFLFLITCIPIVTIGASISSLYTMTLKIVRKEDTYVIRGYFKAFKVNFKQATAFWLIALLLYALTYVIYVAASINGGTLKSIYTVITIVLAVLYSMYFLTVFALNSTFKHTYKKMLYNGFAILIGHFPAMLTQYLCLAIPFLICFGINTIIMQYALLFWMIIGFSVLFLWQSVYLNRVFKKYRDDEEEEQ